MHCAVRSTARGRKREFQHKERQARGSSPTYAIVRLLQRRGRLRPDLSIPK